MYTLAASFLLFLSFIVKADNNEKSALLSKDTDLNSALSALHGLKKQLAPESEKSGFEKVIGPLENVLPSTSPNATLNPPSNNSIIHSMISAIDSLGEKVTEGVEWSAAKLKRNANVADVAGAVAYKRAVKTEQSEKKIQNVVKKERMLNIPLPFQKGVRIRYHAKSGSPEDVDIPVTPHIKTEDSKFGKSLAELDVAAEAIGMGSNDNFAIALETEDGGQPGLFRYEEMNGRHDIFVANLMNSVLQKAHEKEFPVFLIVVPVLGLVAITEFFVELVNNGYATYNRAVIPMNASLYGFSGTLLSLYFNLNRFITVFVAAALCYIPYSIAWTQRASPSWFTKFSIIKLPPNLPLQSILSIRFVATITATYITQLLISITVLLPSLRGIAIAISSHRAGSQILVATLIMTLGSCLLKLYLELASKSERFMSILYSLLIGFISVATFACISNYFAFTMRTTPILLFDPLVFFVPFGVNAFTDLNLTLFFIALLISWAAHRCTRVFSQNSASSSLTYKHDAAP